MFKAIYDFISFPQKNLQESWGVLIKSYIIGIHVSLLENVVHYI